MTSPDFLSVKQVAHLLQVSARTIWRYAADQQFPQPVRFSSRRVRWRRRDIDGYIEKLAPRSAARKSHP